VKFQKKKNKNSPNEFPKSEKRVLKTPFVPLPAGTFDAHTGTLGVHDGTLVVGNGTLVAGNRNLVAGDGTLVAGAGTLAECPETFRGQGIIFGNSSKSNRYYEQFQILPINFHRRNMMSINLSRRRFLGNVAFLTASVFSVPLSGQQNQISAQQNPNKPDPLETLEQYVPQGTLKQASSRFIVNQLGMEKAIAVCKRIGLFGIDLLDPNEWDIVRENGLVVTMGRAPGHGGIPKGFNNPENHDLLTEVYSKWIPVAAEKDVPNLIFFSGNRNGIGDEEGLENCVKGIQRIVPLAEKHGVTLCMELLNGKDHKDYQADRTSWGAELCDRVGSERVKLLYDIYHLQRSEGDLINNINKYHSVIGHYHTAGNPGRRDIDETQEIYYPAVIQAILKTGFTGYLAHEFSPKNGMNSLRRAVEICDVR
jgi:hydroxypyruvate isomerase